VLTLAISDVIGDPPEIIASGPTVPDESTYSDAMRIIQKYELQETLPASILKILYEGKKGKIPETLKAGDEVFQKCSFRLIASNEKSVSASLEEASRLGFETINLGSSIHGEASVVGEYLANTLLKYLYNRSEIAKPICMVGGGETTVSLKGEGFGGRNLEVALAAVKSLAGRANIALVTLASDGEDGPTDAAGAVVTGNTYLRSEKLGLDPSRFLSENDSYRYFKEAGGMICTGSTGTNVMDLFYLIIF
jgi:glycerate-2-kinase